MRVNVYTEELPENEPSERRVKIVEAEYVSSRTGREMTNYGLRIFLQSPQTLHDSANDDDRSAVTFWCGSSKDGIRAFIDDLERALKQSK